MICKLIDLNPGMSKDGNYGEIINSDPHLEMTFYHVLQGATLKVSFESEKDFLRIPVLSIRFLMAKWKSSSLAVPVLLAKAK